MKGLKCLIRCKNKEEKKRTKAKQEDMNTLEVQGVRAYDLLRAI